MMNQELLDYIRLQKQNGATNQAITDTLVANGWDQNQVQAAINSLTEQGSAIDPKSTVPTANNLSYADARSAIKQMGKLKASWRLFTQSLNLLKQDKEIMLFPVVSSLLVIVITFVFTIGLVFLLPLTGFTETNSNPSVAQEVVFYSFVFVYYVLVFFVTTFFKVGLTALVYERINGGNLNFTEGLNRASTITGKIFLWSLITSTVGLILKIISDKSKLLGKLVASLLGAAWNIVTLFIAPTLLLEDVSVWKSIGRSAEVFKQTWGETLILTVSFGFVTSLFVLVDIILFGLLAFIVASAGLGSTGLIIVAIPFVLSLVVISIISSSLNEIFKVTLYSYARFGVIAEGFSPELIVGAVTSKEK